jgi:putative ABC transport system substrate-binding protein
LGHEPGGGLVVPGGFTFLHRADHFGGRPKQRTGGLFAVRLCQCAFASDGGLRFYGADRVDIWRNAATYVDRILRGANPAETPVQLPTKFRDGRKPRQCTRSCRTPIDSAGRR